MNPALLSRLRVWLWLALVALLALGAWGCASPSSAPGAAPTVTHLVIHGDDIGPTLDRIRSGGHYPHRNDGAVFGNYEGRLPDQPRGYYHEWVHPTPSDRGPGAKRIITGAGGEIYYTYDHYRTFVPVHPPETR